ncbi:MAG: hypothetical protein QOF51_1548 [Chloroflexota bacterium]|nr:hypothetical protein [Chloroflexota bacterium]
MRAASLRETVILAGLSAPSGSIGLVVPLYMGSRGNPVGLIGVVLALGAIATLLSRIPVPKLYRPERARGLLLVVLIAGGATYVLLPLMPELVTFTAMLMLNRMLYGMATTIYLARYLDMQPPDADRRRAMGAYGGTQALGYTASNFLIGVIADYVSYFAAFLTGTVTTAIAVVLLVGTANLPAKARASATVSAGPSPRGVRAWLRSMADPGLWSVMNVGAWNHVFHVTVTTFFPVYAVQIGIGPAQVGVVRGMYSGINAVSRYVAGFVLGRVSLRKAQYAGLLLQATMMATLAFSQQFVVISAIFLVIALGRATVIVANSVALAEEVDETRVSRGVATSAYSAAPDVANTGAPLLAGAVASLTGVGWMFTIMGIGALVAFGVGEAAVARWRAREKRSDLAGQVS